MGNNNKIQYFLLGPYQENGRTASTEITRKLHRGFEDLCSRIGCFEGKFSLQVKPDSKLYQVTPKMCSLCTTKPFKEELEWLHQQDIITPLGMDETAEWCDYFVVVPTPNGKVRLCLDPARLNQAFIRQVHMDPHSMIFSKNQMM